MSTTNTTTPERLAHTLHTLTAWQTAIQDVQTQLERLYELFGFVDCPLVESIYRLMSAHTKATARAVGLSEDHWLLPAWEEEGFGKNPVWLEVEGREFEIKTLEELAAYIEEYAL